MDIDKLIKILQWIGIILGIGFIILLIILNLKVWI